MNWSTLLNPKDWLTIEKTPGKVDVCSPQKRELFVKCWQCLSREGDKLVLNRALFDEGKKRLEALQGNEVDPRVNLFKVLFGCLDAIAEFPEAKEGFTRRLEKIAADSQVPVGLVVDVEHEIRNTGSAEAPPAAERLPAWTRKRTVLCGELRRASHSIQVPVLMTLGSHEKDRGVADLRLELVPDGRLEFYPIPALMLLGSDNAFRRAEAAACNQIKAFGIWLPGYSVRWCLELQPRGLEGWPSDLEGDSLRAALEIALTRLFYLARPDVVCARFPNLAELRLDGVAVSAGVSPAGAAAETWGAVGDIQAKLDAARTTFPPIHTVIFAGNQDLRSMNLEQKSTSVWAIRDKGLAVLRVLQAANLTEAISILQSDLAARWSGLEPALPKLPEVNVPRQRLREHIEGLISRKPSGFIEITAEMGRGKSIAMTQLVDARIRSGQSPLFYFIGRLGSQSTDPKHILSSLYLQMRIKYAFEEPAEWRDWTEERKLADLMRKISEERFVGGAKEVIFLDGADEVNSNSPGALVPGILDRLPEGFVCVIATRPEKAAWRGLGVLIQEEKFSELVDEKKDESKLLEERIKNLKRTHPDQPLDWRFNIPEDVVKEPCPTMFTLDTRLLSLEQPIPNDPKEKELCQALQADPEFWRVPPYSLVKQEIERVLAFAENPDYYNGKDQAIGKIGAQRALNILGVHVCVGRPVTRIELEALSAAAGEKEDPMYRLWDRATEIVLRRAKNLFKGDPVVAPEKNERFEFRHEGYKQVILKEFASTQEADTENTLSPKPVESTDSA